MARNHASAVTEGNITSSGGDLDISAPEVRWGDRWFELNIPRGDTNGVGEDLARCVVAAAHDHPDHERCRWRQRLRR